MLYSALVATLAVGAIAQTSTVNIFIDTLGGISLVGSVVAAESDKATYALECASGGSVDCPTGTTFTIVAGPSTFDISTATTTAGVVSSISEHCEIIDSTSADCSVTAGFQDGNSTSVFTSASTLTGDHVHYFQVPITAGAEKLAAATSTAATTGSDSGAIATAVPVVYKVLVPGAVGLAAVMAF